MFKRGYKLIICVVLVSALFIGFGSAFASAEPVWLLRAKAGAAAASLAMQLFLQPVSAILDAPIAQAVDPLNKIEWVETLPDYLDKSVVKVVENSAIIDGVLYSDLWLGPEAAQSLRTQVLDFATAYDILNNQSGAISYASGAGYFDGIPIYQVGSGYMSPLYFLNYDSSSSVGNATVNTEFYISDNVSNYYYTQIILSNGTQSTRSLLRYPKNAPIASRVYNISNSRLDAGAYASSSDSISPSVSVQDNSLIVRDEFSFDYTSGVIDAPIAEDDGLLVRIPSSYTDPQTGTVVYDIHDFIVNYPDIDQSGGHEINIDPSLNPDFQTDIDLGNGIGDLLLTIFGLDLLNKIINFAPEPTTPEPEPQPGIIDPLPDPDPAPADPVSGTTIADTDWTKLDEILRWIQSTIDSIRHITESLQTMLDSLFDQLQQIIESLQSLPDQLLEDIETGPSKVFRKALDVLKSLFMPLLLPIKAMMNLWHYVVEWLQSINAPFVWIFGIMSGTSYNMVLPIYAVLAGSICIAIYKALGR